MRFQLRGEDEALLTLFPIQPGRLGRAGGRAADQLMDLSRVTMGASGIEQSHLGPGDETWHGIRKKAIHPASHGTQYQEGPLKIDCFGGPWRSSSGKGSIIHMMISLLWQQAVFPPGGEKQRRDFEEEL